MKTFGELKVGDTLIGTDNKYRRFTEFTVNSISKSCTNSWVVVATQNDNPIIVMDIFFYTKDDTSSHNAYYKTTEGAECAKKARSTGSTICPDRKFFTDIDAFKMAVDSWISDCNKSLSGLSHEYQVAVDNLQAKFNRTEKELCKRLEQLIKTFRTIEIYGKEEEKIENP